jgi:SAM-dependent methyltransferase
VCDRCLLVQVDAVVVPEHIFRDYAYFSSYSESWLRHAEAYAATMMRRFGYGPESLVVELASNDGYLLQYFRQAGAEVLGIEPAGNVAEAARRAGVPTLSEFFGEALARKLVAEGRSADLIVANNVIAHVPGLNDFVAGIKLLLKSEGLATLEFPHLLELIAHCQFDTIYHEHFSYFSFLTIERVFAARGLTIVDVEALETHGGSLRIHVRHANAASPRSMASVEALRERERSAGLDRLEAYSGFGARVARVKRQLLGFLIKARDEGKRVAGYGAPAKGNTLLNYCGVRADLLEFTVDRSPHKQGKYLPGTHIRIEAPESILQARPDYVLILPWNLRDEIVQQMAHIGDWGGKFVLPIPELKVLG